MKKSTVLLPLLALPSLLPAQTFVFDGTNDYVNAELKMSELFLYNTGPYNWDDNGLDDSVRYSPFRTVAWAMPPNVGTPAMKGGYITIFLDEIASYTASVWLFPAAQTVAVPALSGYPGDIPTALVGKVISDPLRYFPNGSKGPFLDRSCGVMLFPMAEPVPFANLSLLQAYFRQSFVHLQPTEWRFVVQTTEGATYVSEYTLPQGSDAVTYGAGPHNWRYPILRNPAAAKWAPWDFESEDLRMLAFDKTTPFEVQNLGTISMVGIYIDTVYNGASTIVELGAVAYDVYPEPELVPPANLATTYSGDAATVSFDSVERLWYQLEASTDAGATWAASGVKVAGTGERLTLSHSTAANVFLRVLVTATGN